MITYTLPGLFSNREAERIKKVFQGKTFFNFQVEYGGIAGNNQVTIMTENDQDTKEEFIGVINWYAMTNLKEV